jgi:hypothetical protein
MHLDSVKSTCSAISCTIDKLTETANGTVLDISIRSDMPKIIAAADGAPVFQEKLAFFSGTNDVPVFLVPIVFWVNELSEN